MPQVAPRKVNSPSSGDRLVARAVRQLAHPLQNSYEIPGMLPFPTAYPSAGKPELALRTTDRGLSARVPMEIYRCESRRDRVGVGHTVRFKSLAWH
jgi:hypothetical protein